MVPKQYIINISKEAMFEQRIKQLKAALKDEQDCNLIYKTSLEIRQKTGYLFAKKAFIQAIQQFKHQ